MMKLIPAEISAKLTLRKRNKKFNQTRKAAIRAIKSATNHGKYLVPINIPDDWTDEEFLAFWTYFTTQGYALKALGVGNDYWTNSKAAINQYQKYPFSSIVISWEPKNV